MSALLVPWPRFAPTFVFTDFHGPCLVPSAFFATSAGCLRPLPAPQDRTTACLAPQAQAHVYLALQGRFVSPRVKCFQRIVLREVFVQTKVSLFRVQQDRSTACLARQAHAHVYLALWGRSVSPRVECFQRIVPLAASAPALVCRRPYPALPAAFAHLQE